MDDIPAYLLSFMAGFLFKLAVDMCAAGASERGGE